MPHMSFDGITVVDFPLCTIQIHTEVEFKFNRNNENRYHL